MRRKYVLEKYPRFMNFGGGISGFDTKREKQYDTDLPQEIIDEHDLVLDKLYEAVVLLFQINDEAAREWWYGEQHQRISESEHNQQNLKQYD